jgi:hypothetical protein
MIANQAAFEAGQLAQDMLVGYTVHITAIRLPPRLRHNAFVQLIEDYPNDSVPRKDGTEWSFGTQDTFVAALEPAIAAELDRVWLAGSLLALGDALADNDYFDHAPQLELVYHLRNGIAHGNHFKFTAGGLDRLGEHPAHNSDAAFKITPALEGQRVLFDFMRAGDVLDLLSSVGGHLRNLETQMHSLVGVCITARFHSFRRRWWWLPLALLVDQALSDW